MKIKYSYYYINYLNFLNIDYSFIYDTNYIRVHSEREIFKFVIVNGKYLLITSYKSRGKRCFCVCLEKFNFCKFKPEDIKSVGYYNQLIFKKRDVKFYISDKTLLLFKKGKYIFFTESNVSNGSITVKEIERNMFSELKEKVIVVK